MTTSDSDKDKENESPEEKPDTTGDRLEEIKKEEQEDASSYYAQGDKGSPMNVKEEFEKPVAPMDKSREDLNLLRAVAFLGFGLAALAIIFILFFINDLEERVGGVDSAVKQVEKSIEPLKAEVEVSMKTVQAIEANLNTVSDTVSRLQGKLGDYEKSMAIMELKRALAMIQGISMGSNAGVRSKSSDVAASIQSLLSELGGGVSDQPAGEIRVEEAAEEPAEEESAGEESAGAEEEPAEEESAGEESAGAEEEPAEEESSGEESEEATEEPAEEESASEESAEDAEEPAEESAEESHEDAPAESDEHGEESAGDDVEELPTVEELLNE